MTDERSPRSGREVRYLLMVLLVSGAVLHFTLPEHNASAPGACDATGPPLTDLSIVRLYGQGQGDTVSLLAQHAAGRPGAADSFTVSHDSRPWSFWVTTVDLAGNEACASNPFQLGGGGVSVDPEPGPLASWYDVAGRRVARPTAPGVYWWRDGAARGRAVFLR